MAKKMKKSKKKTTKKETKEKKELVVEVSQTQSDVKTFLEKFREEVTQRRKKYLSFAQKWGKKKKP